MVRSLTRFLHTAPEGGGETKARRTSTASETQIALVRAVVVALFAAALLAGLFAGGAIAAAGSATVLADGPATAGDSPLLNDSQPATEDVDQTVTSRWSLAARNTTAEAAVWHYTEFRGDVIDVEEGPDGDRLYSGGYGETVHVVDADTGEQLRTYDVGGLVRDIEVGPNGTIYTATGDLDGEVNAVDAESGRTTTLGNLDSTPYAIELGPSGNILYAGEGRYAYAIDTRNEEVTWSRELDSTLGHVAVEPDDGTVYVSKRDETVEALDTADGSTEWTTSVGSPVRGLAVVPAATDEGADDSSLLVANGSTVRSLAAEDGSQRWSTTVGNHTYEVAVDHENAEAVVTQFDGTSSFLQRVDLANGSTGQQAAYSGDEIWDVEFLGQGPYEAAADAQDETDAEPGAEINAAVWSDPAEPYVGEDVTFRTNGGAYEAAFEWSVDGTEISESKRIHTRGFEEPGEHQASVTFVGENGSRDTATVNVTVREVDGPTARLTASSTEVVVGEPLVFDRDIVSGRPVDHWIDTGENDTRLENPDRGELYTYDQPGTYTAEYAIETSNGTIETDTVPVTVHPEDSSEHVEAAFELEDEPVAGEFLSFDASASEGEKLSYLWEWGDGTAKWSRGPVERNRFRHNATYNVTLTVVGENATDTTTAEITVGPPLPRNASFAADDANATTDDAVWFDAGDTTGHVEQYQWAFGDGQTSNTTRSRTTHVYDAQGSYTVEFTAVFANGTTDTATTTVTVGPGEIQVAELRQIRDGGVVGDDIGFYALDTSDAVDQYHWDFDDGETKTTTAPTTAHSYTAAGNYTVELTGVTNGGARDTAAVNVTVEPYETRNALHYEYEEPLVVGEPAQFSVTKPGYLPNSTHHWDFGDGTTYALNGFPPVYHAFDEPGTYAVEGQIRSDGDLAARTTENVTVVTGNESAQIEAVLDVSRESVPAGSSVRLDGSASTGAIDDHWLNVDGHYQPARHATWNQTFDEPGTYNATLVVVGENATDETTVQIDVRPLATDPLVADPVNATVCEPIEFDATNANFEGSRHEWFFLEGLVSDRFYSDAGPVVEHAYESPGTYTVTARIGDGAGTELDVKTTVEVAGSSESCDESDDEADDDSPGGGGLVLSQDSDTSTPQFDVVNVDAPSAVEPGETFDVTVTVDAEDDETPVEIALESGSGSPLETELRELTDGTASFTLTAPNSPGSYELGATTVTDEHTQSLAVDGGDEDASDEVDGDDADGEAPDGGATEDSGAADGDGAPGFGVAAALVALGGVLLVLRRPRN